MEAPAIPGSPEFLVQFRRTQHAVRTLLDETLAPTGLTMPQYAVLAELESRRDQSSSDLARATGVTAQTMNVLVGRLEAGGFVSRTQHQDHGRILLVSLTRKGQSALRRGRALASRVEETLLAGVGEADRGRLLEILKQVEARSCPT
jgi:DNA-binding MarR family transcriptional regulator